MKNRLLVSFLVVALLVDIAGIVFFILFLTQTSKVQRLQKEKQTMAANIAALRWQQASSSGNSAVATLPEKHAFIAKTDGVHDVYAVLPPMVTDGVRDLTLIVYLHGMGSTYMEPFVAPKEGPIAQSIQGKRPSIIFASPSYRATMSWANDLALTDIDQNIHELMERYPVSKIVIMGTSMGGCSALAYSYLAAEDIKAKIVGVVSCEGAGDWLKLFQKTPSNMVKSGLMIGLGNTAQASPEVYRNRSINLNLDKVKAGTRYALISAEQDKVIPAYFQKELREKLEGAKLPTKMISINEKHNVPSAKYYLEGLDFVLEEGKKND
jgi:hypothetical protein